MIRTLRNYYEEFFKVFFGENLDQDSITVELYDGSFTEVPLLFFKKSVQNYTEGTFEQYPIVALEYFPPTLRAGYNNYIQPRYAGLRDTDGDGEDDTIDKMPFPLFMEGRFELSVAAKDETVYTAINTWFYRNFDYSNQAVFKFNKIDVPNTEPISDLVPYSIEVQESPRTDGVYETIFSFTLQPRMDIQLPKEYATVQDYEIALNQSLVTDIEEFLSTAVPLGITIQENG